MKENKVLTLMFYGIFIFYLFLMIDLLFLRMGASIRSVNFIPFQGMIEYINVDDGIHYRLIDVNIWGNMLVFIPAGIYLMIFNKDNSKRKVLITIFCISLSVEVIQYIFAVGASDIDDIILNCLGGAIGIAIYSLLEKIFKTKDRTKKIISLVSSIIRIPIFIIAIIVFYVNY